MVQYLFEILRCARPGMDIFEPRASCDPTLIGKFRKLIGEEGVEELLAKTIAVAVNLKLISKKSLETVVVDSTVQPKAVLTPGVMASVTASIIRCSA